MKPLTRIGLLGLTFAPLLALADDSFVPLTSLPGIVGLTSAPSLPDFLNSLYGISIGAVAVLAVIQITVAGWEFMTSADSITKNQKAKGRIQNAVFGLVLVLSPWIVFSLINPQILDLNFDVSKLGSSLRTGGGTASDASNPVVWVDGGSDRLAADARCTSEGGTASFICKQPAGTERQVSVNEQCKEGETYATRCHKKATTGTEACKAYSASSFTAVPAGSNTSDLRGDGYVKVGAVCCSGISEGNECWAMPK